VGPCRHCLHRRGTRPFCGVSPGIRQPGDALGNGPSGTSNVKAIVLSLLATACLAACQPSDATKRWASDATGGNPERGKKAIGKLGCAACHTIDGISSEAMVGPPLTRMAARSYVAGSRQNTALNLIQFIQHPHAVRNDTAMPELGITDEEARDIAAYLYTYK
jgi:cytochrome c